MLLFGLLLVVAWWDVWLDVLAGDEMPTPEDVERYLSRQRMAAGGANNRIGGAA